MDHANARLERCAFATGGDLTVRNSIFRNNTDAEGGAIGVADNLRGVLIEECLFENNTAVSERRLRVVEQRLESSRWGLR